MAGQRSLLFIFAHPDDESFGAAGTAARYAEDDARRGVDSRGPLDDIFAGL